MKYFVNDECIGCGRCNSVCPEVFSMTDEGVAVAVEEEVLPEFEAEAADAQIGCPVDAIESKEGKTYG